MFENVSFQLDTNWRLGLVGRNGRGKTTLLRLLQGALPCGGQIHADVEFEYFPYAVEDAEAFTVEVIRAAAPGAEDWQIARECSLLDLPEELLWQTFESLSLLESARKRFWRHCFCGTMPFCSSMSRPIISMLRDGKTGGLSAQKAGLSDGVP